MDALADFGKKEREIMKKTREDFSTYFSLFEKNFNLTYEILLTYLSGETTLPTELLPIISMVPRLISTTKSILNLIMTGHYYDANILMRTFIENLGLSIHLAKNKDQAKSWISGKAFKIASIKLCQEVILFFKEKPIKKELNIMPALYGELSEYVHADAKAIVPHFVKLEEPSYLDLYLFPRYDENVVRDLLFSFFLPALLNVVLWGLLKDEISIGIRKRIRDLTLEFATYFIEKEKEYKKLAL